MLSPLRTNSSEPGKAGPELRVVAIGGGTGLSTLLKGLKRYVMTPALAPPVSLPFANCAAWSR